MLAQIPNGKIAYEVSCLLDEGDRVFSAITREHHHRRIARNTGEERVGGEIELTPQVHRGNPSDRARPDDGRERIVGQTMILLVWLVEHSLPPATQTSALVVDISIFATTGTG